VLENGFHRTLVLRGIGSQRECGRLIERIHFVLNLSQAIEYLLVPV
jgi:hypothetical protein